MSTATIALVVAVVAFVVAARMAFVVERLERRLDRREGLRRLLDPETEWRLCEADCKRRVRMPVGFGGRALCRLHGGPPPWSGLQ